MRHVLERLLRGCGEGEGAVPLEKKSMRGLKRAVQVAETESAKVSSSKHRPGMGTHQK